jgi:hypothetical protein
VFNSAVLPHTGLNPRTFLTRSPYDLIRLFIPRLAFQTPPYGLFSCARTNVDYIVARCDDTDIVFDSDDGGFN